MYTCFPRYWKVECSYESLYKLKWPKEAITINLHENVFKHSQTHPTNLLNHIVISFTTIEMLVTSGFMLSVTFLQTLLGFSDILEHILLRVAQNQSR